MTYSRNNPSDRYKHLIEQYCAMHKNDGLFYTRGGKPKIIFGGFSLMTHVDNIKKLIEQTQANTILDYGSGKGLQYEDNEVQNRWGVKSITCYDPAFSPLNVLPTGKFDGVISTDALEHCPIEDIDWILEEIVGFANKFVYINVACKPAKKNLPDGTNAHCTVKPPEWWEKKLLKLKAGLHSIVLHADLEDESVIRYL